MPRFRDIPQFTRDGSYRVNVPWTHVEGTLKGLAEPHGLDLDPDFQRAHVWTEAQQVRYVEFILRGGRTGRDILFNQSGWGAATRDRGEPIKIVTVRSDQ